MRILLVAGLAAISGLGALAAQQAAPPAAQTPDFRTGTAAVLLDIVVRDSRGRPVRDLKADEVTILEDGSARELRSFRLVEGPGAAALAEAGGAARAAQPDPLRRITLVTLVFDHLTQNGRQLARRAAMDFVKREMPAGQWTAVFALDQRLRLLQDYSRNREALEQAIERATSMVSRDNAAPGAAESREANAPTAYAQPGAEELSSAARTAGGDIGSAAAAAAVREMIQRLQTFTESAETQQRGQSSLFPLMALARAQGALEGRKAILLFSEGFRVPSQLEEAFRSTISEANRANVSFYAVDARGLDTGRDLAAAAAALEKAGRVSQGALAKRGADGVSMDEVLNVDTAQSALRASTQTVLDELSQSTGGFLIANSNDLRKGLDRVTGDLASYYELAYVPRSGEADGSFRAIEVKVARRGVSVSARSGYFALPTGDAAPLLPYELPLLAAAAAAPPPQDFPFDVAAYRFHDTPRGQQHTLVLEAPAERFRIDEHPRDKRYSARISVMALIKDQSGAVVERMSNTYPLEGPLENVAAIRRGNLIFKRQFWLRPGRYVLHAVVRDQLADSVSVREVPVRVYPPAPGIDLSTVAIIRRVDQASEEPDAVEDPFRAGPMRIQPSLETPISKAANSQISAYVIVYPDAAMQGPPELVFEFVQGTTVIGRSTPELPAPDDRGRIVYVATFPTDAFAPGSYELRAIARQGGSQDETRTTFTVVP